MPGDLAAWVAFTTPSPLLLLAFGYGVVTYQDVIPPGLLHRLKVVAVAVVAQAVRGMARTLCPDAPRITLAVLATSAVLAAPTLLMQVGVILAGEPLFFVAQWVVAGRSVRLGAFDVSF